MVAIDRAPVARDVLLQSEAADRARAVSDVSYRIHLELEGGRDTYRGQAVVAFAVTDRDAPLFLDFTGSIERVRLDGAEVEPDLRGHRLWLPTGRLGPRATLEVDYHNAYDHSGAGFHRFLDPEDGAEYVHSDLEPFAAHRLMPCFDQPDLKATFELRIDAPGDWEVVTSGTDATTEGLPDGRLRHRFARTPRFSSYLLAVVAGPYAHVHGSHRDIPLGLYGRRSMARILERESAELLEVTGQGLDVFEDLFGCRFPFGKYDQLFVPEFNAGAMENVAAVTFHDSFLFRDPPTEAQRLERAEVVLHELAHMWFGDLVTLRWWDDLWLNESFATWASFHALATGTRFRDAWQRFNGVMKPAAYRQDQLVTSHPIATPVADTFSAQPNFDAIVYEKGASVLRQLVATIGEDAFATGLRRYVERHAWANATLVDFLADLGTASGRPLDAWAEAWLRTSGVDVVRASWDERDGRMRDLELAVEPPDPAAPRRSHATRVGIVHEVDSGLRVTELAVLAEASRQRVPAADGLALPVLVFPNHGDHDYARVLLDPRSTAFALSRVGELADPLLRQLLWTTLWDMVRDARLASTDYLDAVVRLVPDEPDLDLADAVLGHAASAIAAYVPEPARPSAVARLVACALREARGTRDEGRCRTWLRAAVSVAPDAIGTPAEEQLLDLVDDPASLAAEVDQDLRWSLAVMASAAGRPEAAERVDVESLRDRSDRGVRARIRADAARPEPAAKAAAWQRINGAGYGSFQLTRAAMQGFQWPSQRELLLRFRAPFFAGLRPVFAEREYPFARAWLRALFPGLWAEPDVVTQARDVLADLRPVDANLSRHLREAIDDQERMIRVRARAAA